MNNMLELLKALGISEDIASTMINSNVEIRFDGEPLDKSARLLDNSNSDNFNSKILYKIIFYAIDFSRDTVKPTVLNELDKYDNYNNFRLPQSMYESILPLPNGHLIVKLCKLIETNFEQVFPFVQSLIRKSYPKINNYVKKNKTITDSYYTSLKESYGVSFELPEDRNLFYLLACLLANKYIPEKVSSKNKTLLSKLETTVIAYDLSVYDKFNDNRDKKDTSIGNYIKFEDSLGFFNGDLPTDRKCEYSEPFRELDITPNTNARELRKELKRALNLTTKDLCKPYDKVFNRFIAEERRLNYKNVDKYATTYPYTVAYNDIKGIFSGYLEDTISRFEISETILDLIIDLTMRHMYRFRYGVKKDLDKVLDYICYLTLFIQTYYYERKTIINNSLSMANDNNEHLDRISELEDKIKALELENAKLKTEQSSSKETINILGIDVAKKENTIIKLESTLSELEDNIGVLEKYITELEKPDIIQDSEINIYRMLDYLRSKKVLLIGGNPDFVSKINTQLPFITTISMEEAKRKVITVEVSDIVIVDTGFTSHGDWWKISTMYSDKDLIYIKPTANIDVWLARLNNRLRMSKN